MADSLLEAQQLLAQQPWVPELVLSDLRLRDGHTGVDALDALREQYGDGLNGIIITGDSEPQVLEGVAGRGYEVLQKPLRPAQLRTLMHNSLPAKA